MLQLSKITIGTGLCLISLLLSNQALGIPCARGTKLGAGQSAQLTSSLQSTTASNAAILALGNPYFGIRYDRFILPTNKACASGGCFEVTSEDTISNRAFLTALGYEQWRWGVGGLATPSRQVFLSLADLNAARLPTLLSTQNLYPSCNTSTLQESTQPGPAMTTMYVYEMVNPGGQRCNWWARYIAYTYFTGFNAMKADYHAATDKLAWTEALLQKIKNFYGANNPTGGLTVTVTPAKTVIEPTLNNLRSWMQTAGANKTKVTIQVKDPAQNAVLNANFSNMTVEMVAGSEAFGGHDHASDPANAQMKPTGTLSGIVNNNDGTYTTSYTSSMFASNENVYVIAQYGSCEGVGVSPPIASKIQGLKQIVLPLRGLVHSFVGGTCNHYGATTPWKPSKLAVCNGTTGTSNMYLTTFRENLLHKLLFAYAQEWNAGLYINDASLEFGGAFDVNGDWAYKPHSNHRLGLDVDIALKENKPPLMTSPTGISGKILKRKLESIILSDPMLRTKWVASLHKNHIHLKPNFKKGNWTGK